MGANIGNCEVCSARTAIWEDIGMCDQCYREKGIAPAEKPAHNVVLRGCQQGKSLIPELLREPNLQEFKGRPNQLLSYARAISRDGSFESDRVIQDLCAAYDSVVKERDQLKELLQIEERNAGILLCELKAACDKIDKLRAEVERLTKDWERLNIKCGDYSLENASLKDEIALARDFIDKFAGPIGCAKEPGSIGALAQTYRDRMDAIRDARESK